MARPQSNGGVQPLINAVKAFSASRHTVRTCLLPYVLLLQNHILTRLNSAAHPINKGIVDKLQVRLATNYPNQPAASVPSPP